MKFLFNKQALNLQSTFLNSKYSYISDALEIFIVNFLKSSNPQEH